MLFLMFGYRMSGGGCLPVTTPSFFGGLESGTNEDAGVVESRSLQNQRHLVKIDDELSLEYVTFRHGQLMAIGGLVVYSVVLL